MRWWAWLGMAMLAACGASRADDEKGGGEEVAAKRASEVILADDLNGDGKIEPDEWAEDAAKFKAIDKDNDGTIELAELTEFYRNAAAGGGSAAGEAGGKDAGDDKGAEMKKRLEQMWSQADKDGDGTLDPDEWTLGEEAFTKADTDKDGKIEKEEFAAFMKSARKDPKRMAQAKLKRLDKDGDGTISKEEWPGRTEMFDRLDVDHDGTLTLEELQAWPLGKKQRGQDPGSGNNGGGK